MGTIEPGTLLGERYTVEEVLGRGGFATVYRARQLDLDRTVALKVLDIHEGASSGTVTCFKHEAAVAAHLNHPNVVTIHEYGMFDETPFIAMELLEGRSLEQELRRNGPLEPNRALRLLLPCLHALGKAHTEGIIHKDLKPSNLFITHPGDPTKELLVILDYGIARFRGRSVTVEGQLQGTPQYMAPEYIRQKEITAAVDIYQMGLILSETLTGLPAVAMADPFPCMMAHCDGNLNIPAGLATSPLGEVVRRCVQRLPDQRYANGLELRDALLAVREEHAPFLPLEIEAPTDAAQSNPTVSYPQRLSTSEGDSAEIEAITPERISAPIEGINVASDATLSQAPSGPISISIASPDDVPPPPPHAARSFHRPLLLALTLAALLAGATHLGLLKSPTVTASPDVGAQHRAPVADTPAYMEELDALVEQEAWGDVIALLDHTIAREEHNEGLRLLRDKAVLEQEMKAHYEASLKALEAGRYAEALQKIDIIEAQARTTTYARYIQEQDLHRRALAGLAASNTPAPRRSAAEPSEESSKESSEEPLAASLARSQRRRAPDGPTALPRSWGDPVPAEAQTEATSDSEAYGRLIAEAMRDNARGNHQDAIVRAREALSHKPSAEPHRILALAFERTGDVQRAIHHYNQVITRACTTRLGSVARTRVYQLGGDPAPCPSKD